MKNVSSVCDELFIFCFQLRHALQRQKSLFENINIDWNLSHDEGSTDFSDDDTVIDDRVSALSFSLFCVVKSLFIDTVLCGEWCVHLILFAS